MTFEFLRAIGLISSFEAINIYELPFETCKRNSHLTSIITKNLKQCPLVVLTLYFCLVMICLLHLLWQLFYINEIVSFSKNLGTFEFLVFV